MRLAASASGSRVPGRTSSMATMAPRPRMSPIPGWSDCMARNRVVTAALMVRAAPARSWSTMVRMEASAATHETGLPP